MPTVSDAHIRLDDRGIAWIDDTTTKVIEVALDQIAHGWSVEEIHFQHPHLSLGQIHAALAYYHDHKADFDAEIQRSVERVGQLRAKALESPILRRLRAIGKLGVSVGLYMDVHVPAAVARGLCCAMSMCLLPS
jgi:uncharacterized protein (DUF433 family)